MSVTETHDFLIQWHLTERCNLACSHCYQTGTPGSELSLEEINETLEEIDEMFGAWRRAYDVSIKPSFNITGGEPLLRPDLEQVLGLLHARSYETFLLTNGTLIDRTRARRIAELGVKGAQVSIEGCEEIHESVRGPGSFERASDGIEHLLDAGVPVTLNVTLSRLNAKSMKKVVRFASHIGAQRLGFSRLVPAGKAAGLGQAMLSAAEVRSLYEELFATDIPGLEIVTGDPVAAAHRRERSMKHPGRRKRDRTGGVPSGGCSAGVSGLTLLADGTVVPCRRMPLPIGNVRTHSLRELWAASPVLEALRDKSRYSGKCGSCGHWEECRGCRAIAYADALARGSGDFLSDDPQCFVDR
ncbi:MAG: radical SAM protein [Nitrospiraceae bacterium]|nr:radical SAM protein [Nitrospiraceae bacterium]